MRDRIVIVGGGVAAAKLIRAHRDAGGDAALTMISSDTHLPYNRPPLSKGFLRGELEASAVFVEPESSYAELEVDLRLGATVTAVATDAKHVVVDGAEAIPYNRLVLASGSLPRPLGTPGEDLRGIHTYRTLDDAVAVRAAAESATHALVVGAGFIGMETAASLRRRGLEVALVEPADSLFAALQSPALSASLEQRYREHGITVITGDAVAEFHGTGGRLSSATTRNGETITATLAIIGVGVQLSTGYLGGTGIALDRGSVLVDEHFRSSVPDVFAIGDIANFDDPVAGHRRLIQHWTNASYHGERLGRALAGEEAPYDQVAYFFTELFGTKYGLLGDPGAHTRQLTVDGPDDGFVTYYLDDGGTLLAALISGQTAATQEELTDLLRSHARLHDGATLAGAPGSIGAAFR